MADSNIGLPTYTSLMPGSYHFSSQVCHVIQNPVKKYQTPSADCSYYHSPRVTWTLKITHAERQLVFQPADERGLLLLEGCWAKSFSQNRGVFNATLLFKSSCTYWLNNLHQCGHSLLTRSLPAKKGQERETVGVLRVEEGLLVIPPYRFDAIYWASVQIWCTFPTIMGVKWDYNFMGDVNGTSSRLNVIQRRLKFGASSWQFSEAKSMCLPSHHGGLLPQVDLCRGKRWRNVMKYPYLGCNFFRHTSRRLRRQHPRPAGWL